MPFYIFISDEFKFLVPRILATNLLLFWISVIPTGKLQYLTKILIFIYI